MAEKEQKEPKEPTAAKVDLVTEIGTLTYPRAVDLVTEIGTLTYPRAVAAFGKDRAIEVMHKVAALGGHGMFEDSHFKSPLFGGLAMPSPDRIPAPRAEEFSHLPEAEFYFQAALEEFEEKKSKAVDARAAINDYYASVK